MCSAEAALKLVATFRWSATKLRLISDWHDRKQYAIFFTFGFTLNIALQICEIIANHFQQTSMCHVRGCVFHVFHLNYNWVLMVLSFVHWSGNFYTQLFQFFLTWCMVNLCFGQ
jgi:hypothetical protein